MALLLEQTAAFESSLELQTTQELRAASLGITALSTELDAGSRLTIISGVTGDISQRQNRRIVSDIAEETESTFRRHSFGLLKTPSDEPSGVSFRIPNNRFTYFKIGLELHQRDEMIEMVDQSLFFNNPVDEVIFDLHHRFGVGYLGVVRELIGILDGETSSYSFIGRKKR